MLERRRDELVRFKPSAEITPCGTVGKGGIDVAADHNRRIIGPEKPLFRLEHISEIERRIRMVEAHNTSGETRELPDAPAGFWTVELFRRELTALLEHLNIAGRYHVLGQSWGGMLGAEHALERDDQTLEARTRGPLRHRQRPAGAPPDRGPGPPPRVAAFRQGVISNLANPKMAAFFLSLLPQFVSPTSNSFAAFVALGLVFGRLYQARGRTAPLVVAHFLIDAAAGLGYLALRGRVSWLPG